VITHEENNEEFLHIIKKHRDSHDILERILSLPSGLYYTYIKLIPHVAYKVIFQNVDAFTNWHERLRHPGVRMMRKIIGNSSSQILNSAKFLKSLNFMCIACATGKLILRPSPVKIKVEPLKFLEQIQGDICGLIKPLWGPFRYFMVLFDASTRWSHVCLLSTRNHAFAKFMTQVIRLKANYHEYRLQCIRLDNVAEFSSRAFNDYCMAQGIEVQHLVPYVHIQNGLVECLIKRIKLIARSLLQNYNLPITSWGHTIFYAAGLIQLRPTAYHSVSSLCLVRGNAPSISHLRKFGCVVYAPISLPQRNTNPHRKMGIYVGYHSPSIIKYLESMTGDLFTAQYADCIFNEDHFLVLGGEF
jgi:hypothetical protein